MSMFHVSGNRPGGVDAMPHAPDGQKDKAPAPLDLNDKGAVDAALKALVDQELSAGWDVLLKAPASTEFRHALATLRMHALFDEAQQYPKKEILGDRMQAITTVLKRLSPSGLDALLRSVGDGAQANEFSKFLSPQDLWLMAAELLRRLADGCDVFEAYRKGLNNLRPKDECLVRAQQDYKPVHATYLRAIAAFKAAAAEFEANGLPSWGATIYAAISAIWVNMAATYNQLEQPEQVEHARAAARTTDNERRAHSPRAVEAALRAGNLDFAKQIAQEAIKVARDAASYFTINHKLTDAIAAHQEAITLLRQIGMNDRASEAQMELGDFCMEHHRYREAGDTYLAGMSERHHNPSEADAVRLGKAGGAYLVEGDRDKAKVVFQQAGDAYTMLAKTFRARSAAASKGDHYHRAGQYYTSAGEYYLSAGRDQKALDAFRSAEHAHQKAAALGAGALKAEALDKARDARIQMAKAYVLLAREHVRRAELGPAGATYVRAAELFNAAGDHLRSWQTYRHAGNRYLELARAHAGLPEHDTQYGAAAGHAGYAYRNAQDHAASAAAFQMWADVYLRQLLSREPHTNYITFALRCQELAQSHRAAGDHAAAKIAEMTAAAAFAKDDYFIAAAECCFRAGELEIAMGYYQQLNKWEGLPTLHPDIFLTIAKSYQAMDPVNQALVDLVMAASRAEHLDAVDPVDRLAVATQRVMGNA